MKGEVRKIQLKFNNKDLEINKENTNYKEVFKNDVNKNANEYNQINSCFIKSSNKVFSLIIKFLFGCEIFFMKRRSYGQG